MGNTQINKKRYLIAVFVLCLLLTGCTTTYPFMQDTSNIRKIELVWIGQENNTDVLYEITVLKEISDISGFLTKFNEMECHTIIGDPVGIASDEYGVKIIYENGDYEIISAYGQGEYTSEEGFSNDVGFKCFEPKEFEPFIVSFLFKKE